MSTWKIRSTTHNTHIIITHHASSRITHRSESRLGFSDGASGGLTTGSSKTHDAAGRDGSLSAEGGTQLKCNLLQISPCLAGLARRKMPKSIMMPVCWCLHLEALMDSSLFTMLGKAQVMTRLNIERVSRVNCSLTKLANLAFSPARVSVVPSP